ncbi:nucleotidyltransferase domain-containing protein [Rhodopseudomonas palustris]|uniref:nucleotidyltransferase domain-containing protein n=1 Tax=Rhodopseudomonas palustris TaxID=1076 RepID=UPI002ACDFD55|nr:nucleotidyltransferase domain-containing protein [Rhodopseudomonas palustris]WQG98292.1 nucleotidyltransferase domain-containing protein [Rhodopseudomonas palustris]
MHDAVADIAEDVRLREAVRRLVAAAPVEEIILFGSRARGDHTEDSDFDLCVILNDDIAPGAFTPVSLWEPISDLGLPIQIVPLRRGRFEAARRDPSTISFQIDREGRTIYADSCVNVLHGRKQL